MAFPEVFSTVDATLFRQNTCKTWNNAMEVSQAFQDIALEYAFNAIQNWEMDALQLFYSIMVLIFVSSYGGRR